MYLMGLLRLDLVQENLMMLFLYTSLAVGYVLLSNKSHCRWKHPLN